MAAAAVAVVAAKVITPTCIGFLWKSLFQYGAIYDAILLEK